MSKKIMVLLLSISFMAAVIMAAINPSTVMAIAGLSSTKADSLKEIQLESAKSLNAALNELAEELDKDKTKDFSSKDGIVKIKAEKTSEDLSVNIEMDASRLPKNTNYKDLLKVMKVIQDYLKPILDKKQAMNLCGLVIGDAYAQYRKGKTKIAIDKDFEVITINCSGDTKSGHLMVDITSKLGVEKCQPSKSKTTVMKASPR